MGKTKAVDTTLKMKRLLATVDVGGNSISLEFRTLDEPILKPGRYAALNPDEEFALPKKFKKFCGLAAGIGGDGKLSKTSMDCSIETLKEIKARIEDMQAQGHIVDVIAVGTAPFRDSKNGKAFQQKIQKETGIDLKILTSDEEAAFAAKGVLTHFPDVSGIVIDTGGGSTEFALIEDGKIKDTFSLPLGTRRIEEAKDAEAFIKEHLDTLPPEFVRPELPLIMTGGTFRAISKHFGRVHDHAMDELLSPNTVSLQHVFNHGQELTTMIERAKKTETSHESLAHLFQVNEDRIARIPTAMRLLGALKDKMGMETAILTAATLRDGLRVDRAKELGKPFEMTPSVAEQLLPKAA